MKMNKRIIIFSIFLIILVIIPTMKPRVIHAERLNVAYGGVWTAGDEKHYPVFFRIQKNNPPMITENGRQILNKKNISIAVSHALKSVNESLPFNILFETESEERKTEIDNPYSLAVAITRDDIVYEQFKTVVATIHKTLVNVGLVIILYQTGKDPQTQKDRNAIVFSVPLVGYSMHLQGKKSLSDDEVDDLFILTASKTIRDHLVKRLKNIELEKIKGEIMRLEAGKAIINIGTLNGLEDGQRIYFIDDQGNKIGQGTVKGIQKTESIVILDKDIKPSTHSKFFTYNVKGLSEETYQVVEFKISSKKVNQLFDEKNLGVQVAQWFSDFLVDRSGKTVLPPKVGGDWITSATGVSFALLVKDGQAYQFEVPNPKYPVFLDLTGANSQMIEGNNVNEIWGYKAWLKVDIPTKKFSRKIDETASKNLVHGIQQYAEKDEFFDLIHQLTAKAAKEDGL